MESSFKDLEAKLIFELKKVNWVEHMYSYGELDKKLAISEANDLARSIAEILVVDDHLDNTFLKNYNNIVKLKLFEDFPELVKDGRFFIQMYSSEKNDSNILKENWDGVPEELKEIMEILSHDESIKKKLGGNKNKLRNYVAPYLVYRVNENKLVHHSDEKTKKELYDSLWGKSLDSEFIDTIRNVHEAYPLLYENDLKKDYVDYNYDTMKKRMNKVLPTTGRESNSMKSSHNLNVLEQHVMQLHFLIYSSSYQRFLSNPVNGKVPDYETSKDIKDSMLMFQSQRPVSGIEDELFQRTVIEDTFHFGVFNGVTQLMGSILEMIVKIIQGNSKHESLITLIWLEEINKDIPELTRNLEFIYNGIRDELNKYNELENLAGTVNQATESEESLKYAKKMLMELLDKYDSIYKDEEHIEERERETASELFKMVVKQFYQYEEDETAYER